MALAVLIDDRLGSAVKLRRGIDALADADADAPPLPRTACDIDAVELRAVGVDWRRAYRRQHDAAWQLVPGPARPRRRRCASTTPSRSPHGAGLMERPLLLRLASVGCAAEARLNDFVLGRTPAASATSSSR